MNIPPMIAGLAMILAGLWRGWAHLRRDRLVSDTPLSRIRSAAQGYVKVSGRARAIAGDPVQAPLTHRECVWWKYSITQEERNDRQPVSWRNIENGTSVSLFALADENDLQCLVGPVNAEVTPTASRVWHENGFRYQEEVIELGAELCVLGELRSRSEFGDVNVATAEKLKQWKQDQKSLLARFDTDHNGRIDADEWEAARQAASQEAQRESLTAHVVRTSVISEPANGEPFVIAPLSTQQLKFRERLYAALYFLLGLVGVYVAVKAL